GLAAAGCTAKRPRPPPATSELRTVRRLSMSVSCCCILIRSGTHCLFWPVTREQDEDEETGLAAISRLHRRNGGRHPARHYRDGHVARDRVHADVQRSKPPRPRSS